MNERARELLFEAAATMGRVASLIDQAAAYSPGIAEPCQTTEPVDCDNTVWCGVDMAAPEVADAFAYAFAYAFAEPERDEPMEQAQAFYEQMTAKPTSFESELENLLNRHSIDGDSSTPDFILARFLCDTLKTWTKAANSRENWHGRNPGCGPTQGHPCDRDEPEGERAFKESEYARDPFVWVDQAAAQRAENLERACLAESIATAGQSLRGATLGEGRNPDDVRTEDAQITDRHYDVKVNGSGRNPNWDFREATAKLRDGFCAHDIHFSDPCRACQHAHELQLVRAHQQRDGA